MSNELKPTDAELEEAAQFVRTKLTEVYPGSQTFYDVATDIAKLLAAHRRDDELAKALDTNRYYGEQCPVGMVQVEFVGCDPKDRIGNYGWKPTNHAFADIWVDGKRCNIQIGNDEIGRRGLHLIFDSTYFEVKQTADNAVGVFKKEVDARAALAARKAE